MIFQGENLPVGIIAGTQGAMDVFVFHQSRVGSSVGIDQTVQTEVSVMLQFSVVSAVPVHGLAVSGSPLVDGVIAPFPDESPAKGGIFFRQVEILFKVTGTVPHGVTVFDQQKRLFGGIVQVIGDFFKRRIHAAEKVDVRCVKIPVAAQIKGALVVSQT